MIIRSQDKKCIINFQCVDTIALEQNIGGIQIRYFSGGGIETMGVLGEYSTEEKAIKVLDMIQNAYTQYGTLKDGLGSVHGAFNLPKCFQMPLDSEV